jgi:hypothetical protein
MFNPDLKVDINQEHIFNTNYLRIAKQLKKEENQSEKGVEIWLQQQLNQQISAARYNFRLCIPQYYKEKVRVVSMISGTILEKLIQS